MVAGPEDPEVVEKSEKARELVRQIVPLFVESEPEVIGACLAELTACWLAGFPDKEGRHHIIEQHNEMIQEFIVTFEDWYKAN